VIVSVDDLVQFSSTKPAIHSPLLACAELLDVFEGNSLGQLNADYNAGRRERKMMSEGQRLGERERAGVDRTLRSVGRIES
jgi:hypothetical protein